MPTKDQRIAELEAEVYRLSGHEMRLSAIYQILLSEDPDVSWIHRRHRIISILRHGKILPMKEVVRRFMAEEGSLTPNPPSAP